MQGVTNAAPPSGGLRVLSQNVPGPGDFPLPDSPLLIVVLFMYPEDVGTMCTGVITPNELMTRVYAGNVLLGTAQRMGSANTLRLHDSTDNSSMHGQAMSFTVFY